MITLLLIWCGLAAVCVVMASARERSGTLLLAYFLGLSVIHVPGALNFAGEAPGLLGRAETEIGFRATVAGLAALLVGAALGTATFQPPSARPTAETPQMSKIGLTLLIAGLFSYFVAAPAAAVIPSATAVMSSVGSTLIIGIWAYLYDAELRRDGRRTLLVLAALPLLPLSTLATGGFAGFGIYWMICALCFFFVVSRKRLLLIALAPLVAYVGLSVGVAYFSTRGEIREAVWQEQAGFTERFARIGEIGERFEFYSWNDPEHIYLIDLRLNQNFLVGSGIMRHEQGQSELLYGETVPLWSLIPRAIWPDKPEVGGSGDLVATFTGMRFAEGTSVGAGQPLEFYANFGWTGLIVGYLLLGFVIGRFDRALGSAFKRADMRAILLAGLPGIALIQPGGSLMEIIVSFVGALVAAHLVYAAIVQVGVWRERSAARSALNR